MRPPTKPQGKPSLGTKPTRLAGRQQQTAEATPRVVGRHGIAMKAFLKLYMDCTAKWKARSRTKPWD